MKEDTIATMIVALYSMVCFPVYRVTLVSLLNVCTDIKVFVVLAIADVRLS